VNKEGSSDSTVVQAIWHKADLYSKKEAAEWCAEHDFKTDDYRSRKDKDTSEITHHIHAQFDPKEGVEDSWGFISDTFPEGISASVCQRKDKSMEMQFTKGVQSADDPFEFVMSTEDVDRMGDIIRAKGWDLSEFKNNPIALWGHNHRSPIGVWEKVRVEGKRLIGKLKFAAAGTSSEIDTLRSLVEQRILKAVSVGFMPVEYAELKDSKGRFEGYDFIKSILHETSLVSVPANQNALAVARSYGIGETRFKQLFTDVKDKGHNSAPLAKIEKALGTASKIAGRPTIH